MQLNSFDDITPSYKHIFLSPHFDDVVYSCGGTIGVEVSYKLHPLVITIFAGIPSSNLELSPFAKQLQQFMGFHEDALEVVATRRQEDKIALDHLHANYLWLDYVDAIYRSNPAHYSSNDQLFSEIHPNDLWISKQLTKDLIAVHDCLPDIVWYAPLGVGRHIDHQIVSFAAQHLVKHGARVKFYEDFPYTLREDALEGRLRELEGITKPIFTEVSNMLHLRQEAACMYTSQLYMNFGGKETMYKAMTDYTRGISVEGTLHLERYWTAHSF